jgi:hypothetical protein
MSCFSDIRISHGTFPVSGFWLLWAATSLLYISFVMSRSNRISRFTCIPILSDPPCVQDINFVLSIHKIFRWSRIIEIPLLKENMISALVDSDPLMFVSLHTPKFYQDKPCKDSCSPTTVQMWACAVGCTIKLVHWAYRYHATFILCHCLKKHSNSFIQFPRDLSCCLRIAQKDRTVRP